MSARLQLLVIRSRDLDAARCFYSALGLTLKSHKHGNGPVHLCAEGASVFEVYPLQSGEEPTTRTRLGFEVDNIGATLDRIQAAGGTIKSPARRSPWGYRAVISDPDGHAIELLEAARAQPAD